MVGFLNGDVAGNVVIRHSAVGATLNVGMSPESVDPATGHADIAEQKLEHRGRVDELDGEAVVRPTEGVHDGADLVGQVGGGDDLGGLLEVLGRTATDGGDHGRCVARVELLHDLEDAARVLHGLIDFGKIGLGIDVVGPSGLVGVGLLFLVPSAKEAGRLVEGVAVFHQEGGVGVELYVVLLDAVVSEGIVDEPAEKGDVAAGADLDKLVGDSGSALIARIDDNQLGVAIALGFHGETEANGVVLGGIAAHGEDDIGVSNVSPAVGHGTASECGGQTGHRRAVSYSGLLFHGDNAESRTEGFYEQVVDLVGVGASTDNADGSEAIEDVTMRVSGDELFVARLLEEVGDAVDDEVPRLVFPFVAAGSTILDGGEAALIDDVLLESNALRAECAAIGGMISVTFDVDDSRFDVA